VEGHRSRRRGSIRGSLHSTRDAYSPAGFLGTGKADDFDDRLSAFVDIHLLEEGGVALWVGGGTGQLVPRRRQRRANFPAHQLKMPTSMVAESVLYTTHCGGVNRKQWVTLYGRCRVHGYPNSALVYTAMRRQKAMMKLLNNCTLEIVEDESLPRRERYVRPSPGLCSASLGTSPTQAFWPSLLDSMSAQMRHRGTIDSDARLIPPHLRFYYTMM
jgi:hypothetical protein